MSNALHPADPPSTEELQQAYRLYRDLKDVVDDGDYWLQTEQAWRVPWANEALRNLVASYAPRGVDFADLDELYDLSLEASCQRLQDGAKLLEQHGITSPEYRAWVEGWPEFRDDPVRKLFETRHSHG